MVSKARYPALVGNQWLCRGLIAGWASVGAVLAPAQDYGDLKTLPMEVVRAATGPGITVSWKPNGNFGSYRLQRSGGGLATLTADLPETATQFTDAAATTPGPFEYRVQAFPKAGSVTAYGQLIAGFEVPWKESPGGVLLVVTPAMAAEAGASLSQLTTDLSGEGWKVSRIDLSGTETPAEVKRAIRDAWLAGNENPATALQALLLIGHVPVPYSGNINPDGHPDHKGAWPCDAYYADMDATGWTDTLVSTSTATRAENRNVPGDGKFDQSYVPSAVELSVGRLDFSALPSFAPLTEADLLRRYLERNHTWRTGGLAAEERGVIDDNLATLTEGVGAALRRSALALGGPAALVPGEFLGTPIPCVFGLGAGYGGYTSINGVGSTEQFAGGSVETVFNLVFGSYSGDWDNPDNIVRAVTAARGSALASLWSGRPNCALTGMAIGRTVGESIRAAQSPGNTTCLHSSYYPGMVHQALHGDPTLKLRPIAPVKALRAVLCGTRTLLAWDRSPAAEVTGYVVFRAPAASGPFTRLTPNPVTQPSWIDPDASTGSFYRVHALRLETTAAGTWWNGSSSPVAPTAAAAEPGEIAAWQQAFFGASAMDAAKADHADPDGDGASNLLEFLGGTDPCCSQSIPPPPRLEGSVVTYTVAAGITEAAAWAECSDDLITWHACENTCLTPGTAPSAALTLTAYFPDRSAARRQFYRITAVRR